jgi:glutamate racemase
VAHSLQDYLRRHPEMDARCTRGGGCQFLTTESVEKFGESASVFLGDAEVNVESVELI